MLYQNLSFSEYEDRSSIIAVGGGCASPIPTSTPVMRIQGHKKIGKGKTNREFIHIPHHMEKHNNGMTRRKKHDQIEEHTSELQSRQSISYAVFCL